MPAKGSAVLAAAKVLYTKTLPDGTQQFYAEGPQGIEAVILLALPDAPAGVTIDGTPLAADSWAWDAATKTLLLRFPNSASGHWVRLRR